ncbi:MAG: thioredoxin-dependent thiol peroxidase [Crocinitomicaceae bacterium]|nr:thioredoxin-dependent thiol peroxidase [Crocinitomicaceae bacterium]MCF8411190.1 thioredoxin-dependent thiol peroxidase [Crocinitomicaceae bacterium]
MSQLKVGDVAPPFKGVDQNGDLIELAQFSGKKVALYFYPKDDTPGCTTQACNLRDNLASLTSQGIEVIGVSTDSIKSHTKFVSKYSLNFPLIADENKEIVEQYGVWGLKKFMGREYMGTNRTTFIIDEKGIIQEVISKPKTATHAEEILTLIK